MRNSTLRICAMLLAFCTSAIHLQAMDEWDGATAKGFYSGTGTKVDPYRIFTASQFLYFLQQTKDGNTFSGQYIELCNDIAFKSNIGLVEGGDFYGDFDGNDHIIQVNEYWTTVYYWYGWTLFNLYGSMHDVQFINANEMMKIYTGGILYNCRFEYPSGNYHGWWTIYLEGGTIANCVSNSARYQNKYEGGGATGLVYGSNYGSNGYCSNCYFLIQSYQYGSISEINLKSNYSGVKESCGEEAGNDWVLSHTEHAYKSWPLTFSPTYPEYLIEEQPNSYNPSVIYPHSDNALYQWYYQKRKPITFEGVTSSSSTQTMNFVVPDDDVVLSFDFTTHGYVSGRYDDDYHYAWVTINGEEIVHVYDERVGTYSCPVSAGTYEISCEYSDITNIRITYPTETLANETSNVLSKQTIMEKPGAYFCQVSYGEGCDVMYSDYVDYEKLLTIDNVTYVVNEDATATVLWVADKAVDITIPQKVNYDDVNYPVTSISSKAFVDCTSLASIKCKTSDALTLLGGTTFEGTIPSNVTLYVSVGSESAYSAAEGWKEFSNIQAMSGTITIDPNIATGTCGDNLTWTLTKEGELKIQGAGAMSDFKSKQSPWYEYVELIQKLTIEEGVISIGNYAFYGCTKLSSINIANDVIKIGSYAFYDCIGLISINIPNGVTCIGNYAFASCDYITSVTIPESVTSIGSSAFDYCYKLTSVNICNMEAWCKIDFGNRASNPLYHARNLYLNSELVTELTIPNTITAIKSYSFFNCNKLTSITIPEGVKSVGTDAFYGCNKIESLTIPKSVISIEGSSFDDCSGISSIVVCEGNTVYDSRNSCNAIITKGTNTLIVGCLNTIIPETVEGIGNYAFSGRSNLTSIVIPEGVTSIGSYAFEGCSKLTSIIIPESMTDLGTSVFYNCSKLTSVIIPQNVTNIGSYAFSYCINLVSINIPTGITNIENSTFSGCSNLTTITIPESVTKIGGFAFYGCI